MPRALTASGRAALEAMARRHLDTGLHHAAQLAVYRDGIPQIDVRLGTGAPGRTMDHAARLLWFSSSKPLIATAVLLLAERGAVSLDTPVASVWPEFAAGGKAACTIRDVLLHRGGFPAFPPTFDWAHIDDWDAVTAATAALPAEWAPGTEVGYHPVTFGFALGEVVRRVDGRSPRAFLHDELLAPLGVDASLGVPPERVRDVVLPEALSEMTWLDPAGTERRTTEIVQRFSRASTLTAQIPAANMIGTADALARFYAMLERGGTLDGVRVLRAETVREATRMHVQVGLDRTLQFPAAYGLGFQIDGPLEPFNEPGVFGHTGQQCTIGYADPARGLAVAYVTNGLHDPMTVQLRYTELALTVIAACAD